MKKYSFIFVLFFTCVFLLAPLNSSAQMTDQQKADQEAQWQAELTATEKEIAQWQSVLDQTKKGTASLQNDAAVLQAKINEAKAFIKQRQIQIEQLTSSITVKTKTINDLEDQINKGKESLAAILRSTDQLDLFSLPEVILSDKNLSEFFIDIDSYNSIKTSLQEKFKEIRDLETKTDAERAALSNEKNKQVDTQADMKVQQAKVQQDETQKQQLITINKTQEKTYAQVIAEKQAKAAQIRAALFSLRDTQGIPFGDALKYATLASQKTGVRAALILAILTQESDLGKNQGSCLVNNLDTGDGAGKNTGTLFEQVMKAPRDTIPFKNITDRLGKDWKMTPVSCPPGTIYTSGRGFGGGMGPSQFIPSTWELFKDRLGSALGLSGDSVNPWNPEHAILATAVYMEDLGAANGGYTAESNAACKYYSGRSCDNKKPANSFYGTQVLATAENIQLTMIDPLEGF
jgi:membrane-bound lytic murein transglycosylase B